MAKKSAAVAEEEKETVPYEAETRPAKKAEEQLETQEKEKEEQALKAKEEEEKWKEVEKQQKELEPSDDKDARYKVGGQSICIHDKLYNSGAGIELTEEEAATLNAGGLVVLDTQPAAQAKS